MAECEGNLQKFYTEKKLRVYGIFLILAGFLPYLLLGKGSVITVHDQLDGEIFTYIFQAKYLFTRQELIPEWMGGIARTALFPPSMLTVLFYKVLSPLPAFLGNQLFVVLTAFFGMNAFLKKLTKQRMTAFISALLFAFLPFYSVYGLSIAGIPMLVFALWELGERKQLFKSLLLVLLYGLTSSFVLIGFAVVGILLLFCICLIAGKRRREYRQLYAAAGMLTCIYLGSNLELVKQVAGIGETTLSHKTTYVLHSIPFGEGFSEMLFQGSSHAASLHGWILLATAVILAAFCVRFYKRNTEFRKEYRLLLYFFLAAVGIALFYGLFQSAPVCSLRQRLGGIFVYFQFDRIYWLYPFLWYTILALDITILLKAFKGKAGQLAVAVLVICTGCTVLWNSDFKKNVRQLAGAGTSNAVTWEKYYGEEIFGQIRDYIGRDQADYRVGSIALNPAAAAYNGFYTVDGYSNNYDLSYKQKFRKVIAKELEKSPELQEYYDDWGNRCYLFTAEMGQNTYIEDEAGMTLKNLELDRSSLLQLGCEYVLSGVYIENAERQGLLLEQKFTAEKTDCRYGIYLYKLAT